MRILVAGDSHCDVLYMEGMYRLAERHQCDKVFVVGDFGFWPAHPQGHRFLARCSELAEESGRELYWLDGNHEDHRQLAKYVNAEEMVEIRPGVNYCPRGYSWEWDGVKFLSIGGAYSIRSLKVKIGGRPDFLILRGDNDTWRDGWFRVEELITDEQVERCKNQGKVDVVLAHDVASVVAINDIIGIRPDDKSMAESTRHQQLLTEVIESAQPKLFIHGHYHYPYSRKIDGVEYIGLAHNVRRGGMTTDSYTVIDTEEFSEG